MKKFIAVLTAVAALTIAAAPASADTTATGNSSVTADVVATLEATFPAAYAWGNLNAGVAGNTSVEQTVNVKSNAAWGVKTSTDDAAGKLTEWDGLAYDGTPLVLTHPLQWRLSHLDGVVQGTSFADYTSTSVLVTTNAEAVTPDAGVDVDTTYKQTISYGDFVAGVNDYRVLVTYDVSQAF